MSGGPLPPPSADWAFFLDIDGTLLEHADRPEAVKVGGAMRRLLSDLQQGAGGALALISGRSVADIDGLFAPLVLPAAGQHGAYAAAHPQLVFEDKGQNLALHYRLAPQLADEVGELMRDVANGLGEAFELQRGKMVLEIRSGGRDKGSAIAEFMQEPPFHGRTPVFIGDDLTDEFGFGVVNDLGGVSVKVGEGSSRARWRIADAASVRAWLGEWTGRYVRRQA
jgi:trehalose 6-phosphate phosphatase